LKQLSLALGVRPTGVRMPSMVRKSSRPHLIIKMKFLKEPEKRSRSWLAVQDDADELTLHQRILSADVCISDLDGTDADPAEEIVLERKVSRFFTQPKYAGWMIRTGWSVLTNRNPIKKEAAVSECWREYINLFLRDEKALSELQARFTVDKLLSDVYPRVEEFYSILRAQKFYVTRNIYPIAFPFSSVLGFSGVISEVENKEKSIKSFVKRYPYFQRYIVKGDSVSDGEMNDVLKFYKKKEVIKDIVSIYVSKKPQEGRMNPEFEINIGKDYTAVVDFIKYGPLNKNLIST